MPNSAIYDEISGQKEKSANRGCAQDIRNALSGDAVSIGWQGGEPALMGLDFYKRAIELEKKYGHGQSVGNGFQTNGTLLDRDWAKFFKQYDWLIGLSLDGRDHPSPRMQLRRQHHE